MSHWTRIRRATAWLFRTEKMPANSEAKRASAHEKGFLTWLFEPESLPEQPPTPGASAGGILEWLFRPERLPDPPDYSHVEEETEHGSR